MRAFVIACALASSVASCSSDMPAPSLVRAEALLAASGHRWVAVPWQPVRWSRSDVAAGSYRTEPDHQVTVIAYAFASEASAAAARPEIDASLLDGNRSAVVQRAELIFLVTSPMGLPGRPLPPDVNATFDAVVASVRP